MMGSWNNVNRVPFLPPSSSSSRNDLNAFSNVMNGVHVARSRPGRRRWWLDRINERRNPWRTTLKGEKNKKKRENNNNFCRWAALHAGLERCTHIYIIRPVQHPGAAERSFSLHHQGARMMRDAPLRVASHVLSSGGHVITITLTMTRLTLITVVRDGYR
jgi:hypothetical protein